MFQQPGVDTALVEVMSADKVIRELAFIIFRNVTVIEEFIYIFKI